MDRSMLESLMVRVDDPIRVAVSAIDRAGRASLALLVDASGRLLATLTDGDIRRGLLAGLSLDAPVRNLLPIKAYMPNPEAVTVGRDTEPAQMLALMQARGVRQLPLVDAERKVVDIITLQELLPNTMPPLEALVMAGGFGTRLKPLTDDTPKSMLPVSGKPVLEWILDQLRGAGIEHVCISTHYRSDQIKDHFGDGKEFGVAVDYVHENEPLGTGGALGLMPRPDHPILVINGDILTRIDVRKMLDFHQEHRAELTMAVSLHEFQVPYGVVHTNGPLIRRLEEKPKLRMVVNAGIYLLQPTVYDLVPQGTPFHMTDLVQWLLDAHRPVVSFPIREYWLDIGQHKDYEQAQTDSKGGDLHAH